MIKLDQERELGLMSISKAMSKKNKHDLSLPSESFRKNTLENNSQAAYFLIENKCNKKPLDF